MFTKSEERATNYTAGPWHISPDNELQINDSEQNPIAWTETCIGMEKDKANARLIAAAPELLLALKHLIDAAEMYAEMAGEDFIATYARNIVAKAEGKEA